MKIAGINFTEKFSLFDELWTPKCVARLDNYIVKLGKIKGDFTWHTHAEADEIFIVNSGSMRLDTQDGPVELSAGEMYVGSEGDRAQALCGGAVRDYHDRA